MQRRHFIAATAATLATGTLAGAMLTPKPAETEFAQTGFYVVHPSQSSLQPYVVYHDRGNVWLYGNPNPIDVAKFGEWLGSPFRVKLLDLKAI